MGDVGQRRRIIGFPALVVLIILIGSGVVAIAWSLREAESRPGLSDHWHSAYAVWDCTDGDGEGAFQPIFEGRLNPQGYPYDPEGIHSHSDGIIHIHPFTANAAGEDAIMAKFFESMFVKMDVNGITASEFGVISAVDAECDGQPAVMQIVRWSRALTAVAAEPDERIYDDFGDVRFKRDGEAFTIALAWCRCLPPSMISSGCRRRWLPTSPNPRGRLSSTRALTRTLPASGWKTTVSP